MPLDPTVEGSEGVTMELYTTRCVGNIMATILHLVVGDTEQPVKLAELCVHSGREGRAWERIWGPQGLDSHPLPDGDPGKAARADQRRDLLVLYNHAVKERREALVLAQEFCEALGRWESLEDEDGYGWAWAHEWAGLGKYRVSVSFEKRLVFQSGPQDGTWIWPLRQGPEFVPYPPEGDDD